MLIDDQKPGVIFRGQDVSAQSESRAASAYQQYAEPPPYESFQRTRSTSSGSYAAQQPTRSPNSQLPFPPELSSSSVDDTVPVSFSRQPPPHLLHTTPFPPIFLIAKGHHLDKGFPICPPPSKFQPHPFTTHDVNEGDWTRLLEDIRKTAMLTGRDVRLAQGIPIINILPVVGGLVEYAIKQHIKRRKAGPVSNLIETWNHHFFHPRRMEVVLMQGQVRVSGDGPIPDADVFRNKFRAASASSVSISSSSLDDTARNDADRHRKRDERDPADPKAQHPDRRGPAGKAKEEKKKEKSDKTYRLFVVAAT